MTLIKTLSTINTKSLFITLNPILFCLCIQRTAWGKWINNCMQDICIEDSCSQDWRICFGIFYSLDSSRLNDFLFRNLGHLAFKYFSLLHIVVWRWRISSKSWRKLRKIEWLLKLAFVFVSVVSLLFSLFFFGRKYARSGVVARNFCQNSFRLKRTCLLT